MLDRLPASLSPLPRAGAGRADLADMSPVSRKRKKRKGGGRAPQRPMSPLERCDCPECTGEAVPDLGTGEPMPDLGEFVETVLAGTADLVAVEDPLDAQVAAAMFVGIGTQAPSEFEQAMVGFFVPAFEAAETPGAVAFLLALASVAPPKAAKAARAAADRLTTPDLLRPDAFELPAWAAELQQPWTVTDACRLIDDEEGASVLAARFHRAGRSHAVTMAIDDENCGVAVDILVLDAAEFSNVLADIEGAARAEGVEFEREALQPAQFRWWAQRALDARAMHDAEGYPPPPDDGEEDQLPYGALAALVRAHLRTLPAAKAPPGAPRNAHRHAPPSPPAGRPGRVGTGVQEKVPKLPPKRTKSAGPAPIYQVKVSLRGAKPPIWRRLEVPADITLAGLHQVLQTAFDWYDSHLHEFDTPYGRFGRPDPDPMFGREVRSAGSATLEQVARGVGAELMYTYDFGDDWEHEIVVEKLLDAAPGTAYPRCTDGRRAAPPEDCGGIWGYQEVVAILADPDDAEHAERLEWLGLADASEFDPAAFSAADITAALTGRTTTRGQSAAGPR